MKTRSATEEKETTITEEDKRTNEERQIDQNYQRELNLKFLFGSVEGELQALRP